MADNDRHCQQIARLIQEILGRELIFAFICGSRARRDFRQRSDVDFVAVLVDQPSIEQEAASEREFYQHFVAYHSLNTFSHTHCGQLLRKRTLDHLLQTTFSHFNRSPQILESICYMTSCPFSEFRKGRVVMGMLAGLKTFQLGDFAGLEAYSRLAGDYFELENQKENTQFQTGAGIHGAGCELDTEHLIAKFRTLISASDYSNTPVGIHLDQWFNSKLPRPKTNNSEYANLVDQCCLAAARNIADTVGERIWARHLFRGKKHSYFPKLDVQLTSSTTSESRNTFSKMVSS